MRKKKGKKHELLNLAPLGKDNRLAKKSGEVSKITKKNKYALLSFLATGSNWMSRSI